MAIPTSRQELVDYVLRKLGAPVLEVNVAAEQIDDLVDEIIETFNSINIDERLGLRAVKYRTFHEGHFKDKLPDIKFENSEAIFFDNSLDAFVVKNKSYGPIPITLSSVKHAAFTGDKSETPLNIASSNLTRYIDNDNIYDLTFIYELIKKANGI